MDEATIGVGAAVSGTVVGFALSEWQRLGIERQQARSVRTLLGLEINQNLVLLSDFWNKVNQVDQAEQQPDSVSLQRVRRLVKLPLPDWSHRIWESQTSLLTISLSGEEIQQIYDFYNQLDAITAIRAAMSTLESEQQQDQRAAMGADKELQKKVTQKLIRQLNQSVPELWLEFEQVVYGILGKGNPLQDSVT